MARALMTRDQCSKRRQKAAPRREAREKRLAYAPRLSRLEAWPCRLTTPHVFLNLARDTNSKTRDTDPGHPAWRHGAYQDVMDSVRFHSRSETGQAELVALEKALEIAMSPAGSAREAGFQWEVSLFEVEM
ncbi:hypothetical protein PHJA_001362800 [Phtheirospermum japonicum]|uniref:Uncharacterized protein n=1 Tax=Phtheirospermum japonicum TaxID=374723 RepID=A0A830BVZ0_9LAMI|nr:hypothetical protein PHJA_001362800 [Phtheirospermum japonicum]